MVKNSIKSAMVKIAGNCQLPVAVLFLVIITIKYPLFFVAPFPSGIYANGFFISSIEQLSAFSIFMILLRYSDILRSTVDCKKTFIIALAVFFLIAFCQFILWDNQTIQEFCYAISWISIPFAVFLYADAFKKLLIPYFSFLWVFSMAHSIWQLVKRTECVGISGNRNWHGAFLIAATPFFLYWLYLWLGKKRISITKIIFILSLPFLLALYELYKAESRGANLALIITSLLFLGLELNLSANKKVRRSGRIYVTALSCILVLSLIVFPLFFGDKLAEINSRDVRIPMWRGALEMFWDNPRLGVGASGFEGHYAYYMPIEKFLRSHHFAGRSNHPHNQLLFFAGAFGLIGLIAICYLWFAPIIIFFRNYSKADIAGKLIFYSFLMLVIHSMLDLVAVRWPTMQMILILLGILWCLTLTKAPEFNIKLSTGFLTSERSPVYCPALIKYFSCITGCLFLLVSLNMAFVNTTSSFLGRNAAIAAHSELYAIAIDKNQQAIDTGNKAEDLHDAAMQSLFWFNDYLLAYKFFTQLENHPAKLVVHANSRTAQCLIKMNRKKEAMAYLDKEIKVFPLSSLAVYNKFLLEKDLGNYAAAEKTELQLIKLMQFKGLKLEDIKKIIAKPELDNRFHQINEQ